MKTKKEEFKVELIHVRSINGWIYINPKMISEMECLHNGVAVRMSSGQLHIFTGKAVDQLMKHVSI